MKWKYSAKFEKDGKERTVSGLIEADTRDKAISLIEKKEKGWKLKRIKI